MGGFKCPSLRGTNISTEIKRAAKLVLLRLFMKFIGKGNNSHAMSSFKHAHAAV